MNETNDLLKLLRLHAYHNPLQSRTCEFCRTEEFRQSNTPIRKWSRAAKTFVQPPLPIAIMAGTILVLIATLALTI